MQIIALERTPFSSFGGKSLSMLEVCQGLAKRGHQVSLLHFQEGDLLPEYRQFCEKVLPITDQRVSRQKPVKSVLEFLNMIKKTSEQLNFVRGNAVIYVDYYSCCYIAAALALSHNWSSVFHLRMAWRPELIFHLQDHLGIKSMRQVITVSQHTKNVWSEKIGINSDKIQVVYEGTNTDRFLPIDADSFTQLRQDKNISLNQKVISYVGIIVQHKGIETLIKACALLGEEINWKLLIAGNAVKPNDDLSLIEGEKYLVYLQDLVDNLGIGHRVSFLGHIPDTTSIYHLSDVTVLPSIYREPFGRSIIESMACGVPVIASRIGGIPEILTDEFELGLFHPDDSNDLAEKLKIFLNWRDNNPQLGELCRSHILANFYLDKTVSQVEMVLQKVLKK